MTRPPSGSRRASRPTSARSPGNCAPKANDGSTARKSQGCDVSPAQHDPHRATPHHTGK